MVVAGPGLDQLGQVAVVGAVGRTAPRRDEPPELPGPVEPDQDLTEEALVAGGLAARLEDLDGRLGHRARDVRLGRADAVEPLGRREQAPPRRRLRVPGAAGDVRQDDVRPGPGTDRHRRPGRHELDRSAGVLAGLGEPGADQPVPGGDAAQGGRHETLGAPGLEDEDRPTIAREERSGRVERPADRR